MGQSQSRGSVSIFEISNNSKEAKKLIILQGSEKLLKDLANHQRIHTKYGKYPSLYTVPLSFLETSLK